MPLNFNASWRFDSEAAPGGSTPRAVINELSELISKIATQGNVKSTLEHFKRYFASAAGTTSSPSSNAGWAQSDLDSYMEQAATNPALFIEAFHDACSALREDGTAVPDVSLVNRILAKHQTGYRIIGNDLVFGNAEVGPITVAHAPASLDQQALEVLQNSISRSERFLREGEDRQAVQELLWVLETLATAFRGVDTGAGTVEGKYFNKIVSDLRSQKRGTTLNEVLDWVVRLHGYVSSPTGGGIRHGADVRTLRTLDPHEARLYCNLIKSYISFLIDEHTRLVSRQVLPDDL